MSSHYQTIVSVVLILIVIVSGSNASELALHAYQADLLGDVKLCDGLIQDWHGHDSVLTWNVKFKQPGTVAISLYQACDPGMAGSVVELSLAGQKVDCTIKATSGWIDYQRVDLGEIKIPKAGNYKVVIKPIKKPKRAVANLSKVLIEGASVEDAIVYERKRKDIVSTFGWDGDKHAAIAFPGSFMIRDGKPVEVGFDIFYNHETYKWYNHSGYLPCLVTEFEYDDCNIKIMNFADKVRFGRNDVVVAYSRVVFSNNGSSPKHVDPGASEDFVHLNSPDSNVGAGQTVNFDYAIALDRFGKSFPMPSKEEIAAAGSWDEHFQHMKEYWNNKLAEIAIVETPDQSLNDAYKAGFIYTHIVKDGNKTNVGENGYDRVFDHDATGILATLLTIGYFSEAEELLDVLPVSFQYDDATWKYSWPFALYLLKTGDKAPALKHWDQIKMSARKIVSDRTGPGGIMKSTHDVDSDGLWTIDNWSGLFGMACYQWLCEQIGEESEANWANKQYNEFLDVVNKTLAKTIKDNNINYIPASIVETNEKNRCKHPNDANWAAHFFFGRWAWDGWLVGANQQGPNIALIDSTYDYGFGRLKEAGYPPHTYGGYPGYCTAYNAGYAGAALRGQRYRTEGIRNYQFMISNAQSGPFSWWEGIHAPSDSSWEGIHPSGGTGSCPHMWGQSCNSKVLVESIAAEFYDGRILIGRGIPNEWLRPDKTVAVTNFPVSKNRRIDICIRAISADKVLLFVDGDTVSDDLLFNLPVMMNNIKSASKGQIDNYLGTVTLKPGTRDTIVTLEKALH